MAKVYFLVFSNFDNGYENPVSKTVLIETEGKYDDAWKDGRRMMNGENPRVPARLLELDGKTEFKPSGRKNVVSHLFEKEKETKKNGVNIKEIKGELFSKMKEIQENSSLNAKQKQEAMAALFAE